MTRHAKILQVFTNGIVSHSNVKVKLGETTHVPK